YSKSLQNKLNEGWEILLRNQFHDIIPGTSIRETNEDSAAEYAEAEQMINQTQKDLLSTILLTEQKNKITVFNNEPWFRDEIITVPTNERNVNGVWEDKNGNELTSCKSGDQWKVWVNNIPSMGTKGLYFKTSKRTIDDKKETSDISNGIKTKKYDIKWNEYGQLTKIYDITSKRDILSSNSKGNVLQVFEDKPMAFDAWDIDI